MEGDRYVTVHVATELLAELGDWSQPIQVRIEETPGHGTGYEMIARTLSRFRVRIFDEGSNSEWITVDRRDVEIVTDPPDPITAG